MADLHQLRGRVGRGGREGYCYLFIEDKEALSENAKKRLLALEKYSALGLGQFWHFMIWRLEVEEIYWERLNLDTLNR